MPRNIRGQELDDILDTISYEHVRPIVDAEIGNGIEYAVYNVPGSDYLSGIDGARYFVVEFEHLQPIAMQQISREELPLYLEIK